MTTQLFRVSVALIRIFVMPWQKHRRVTAFNCANILDIAEICGISLTVVVATIEKKLQIQIQQRYVRKNNYVTIEHAYNLLSAYFS